MSPVFPLALARTRTRLRQLPAFAREQGLDHHPVQLGFPRHCNDLPRVIGQMDRPVGDALILAFDKLASHTSELGCKVALGGEGPDEHFAGYSFHQGYLTSCGRLAIRDVRSRPHCVSLLPARACSIKSAGSLPAWARKDVPRPRAICATSTPSQPANKPTRCVPFLKRQKSTTCCTRTYVTQQALR